MATSPADDKPKTKRSSKKNPSSDGATPTQVARPDWFWRCVVGVVLLFVMSVGGWLAYQVVKEKNAQPYSNAKMEEVLACAGSMSTHMGVQINTATASAPPGAASAAAEMAISTYVDLHIFKQLPPDKRLDGMKFFAECMAKQRKAPNALLEPGRKASNIVFGEYSRLQDEPTLPTRLADAAVDAVSLYRNVADDALSPKERAAKAERIALMYFVATEVHLRRTDEVSKRQAIQTSKGGLEAAVQAVELAKEHASSPDFISWKDGQNVTETLADRWLEALAQAQAVKPSKTNAATLQDALDMMSCEYIQKYRIGSSVPLKRISFASPRLKECGGSNATTGTAPPGPLK